MRIHINTFKFYILPLLLFLAANITFLHISGQELPKQSVPPRLVVDYTGTLNASERTALERKLVNFNDTTSNQIVIVVTDNLLGLDIEEYATGIGDKWGVGQSDLDNGIVIVVKPKTGNNRGLAFISVGYGLEGAIPDITAGQVVDYEMIPHFKQNNYYAGLDAATTVLMELAAGEYTSDEYVKSKKNSWWAFLPFFIIALIFILINRASRRSRTIGSKGMSPWTALWIGGMMGSAGRSSSWGGSSGGGFSGGGGFGGFGGGGFGGGGAGGSW
ncbi:MAG: TPM domain-containing protein [Bacteroidales bacterium]|nr:TPM domain-containing protein [Bacteroidales bacterium]